MSKQKIHEELIKNLPDYERKSALINQIVYSVALKFNNLNASQLENEHELFIDTAVKALQIHARDLGISIGSSLSVKQQRELVTAHYRATFEQTNESTIKGIASSFSNGEVEISPINSDGIFEIKFTGLFGVPTNMDGLKKAIYTILPAHLDVTYAYSYILIRDINKMTIENLSNRKLSEFAGGTKENGD